MNRLATSGLVIIDLLGAARAEAQQMTLVIRNGRVTLDARNVPVRQILAEWARVGGVRIVNGDKVAGAGVTLQLADVPERQAIDIILRGVSGYMLAARPAGTLGASLFDRILILPASATAPTNPAAPAPARPAPVQGAPRNLSPVPLAGFARQIPQVVTPDPDDSDAVPGTTDADLDTQFPQPRQPQGQAPVIGRRPFVPNGQPVPNGMVVGPGAAVPASNGAPSGNTAPGNAAPPPEEPPNPASQPAPPNNPFGVPSGSGRPGVVTPAQPPAPQGAPAR